MIIRVLSPIHGTKRVEVTERETLAKFYVKVREAFNLSEDKKGVVWSISKSRNGEEVLSQGKSHCGTHLKHGQMVYLCGQEVSVSQSQSTPMDVDKGSTRSITSNSIDTDSIRPRSSVNGSITNDSIGRVQQNVVEDDVDLLMEKMDGRILRQKNEQLCRHGASGKCIHCVPLEPYDEAYLAHCDPPIKFMSFHAYIRKLKGGADKGKFVSLENISCRIKNGCTGHLPWPEGICTKCQPNAVTLQAQKYRHVDYVQFENPSLMERFLDYWRSTGHQRIGHLYGKYTAFENSPLGIQAVVSAIYEPPQKSTSNSCTLLEDEQEGIVEEVARKLGLQRVGWIFTDLVAEDLAKGTVRHYRGTMDTFFLSAQECVTAAHFQNKWTNPCKLSHDGHFGSKFVTVVVTGNSANEIHFEAYQVSNQCMALVRDNCLVPTFDAPELGYIRESNNDQYVPDVFYTEKDKYGNEIKRLGRPLPVDYLLVDMPVAFPVQPSFTFSHPSDIDFKFPIENRSALGEIQDFNAFARYIRQFPNPRLLESVTNFHLLLFISTCELLHLQGRIDGLLSSVRQKDLYQFTAWSEGEEWQTAMQLVEVAGESSGVAFRDSGNQASGISGGASSSGGGVTSDDRNGGSNSIWQCQFCTFLNKGGGSGQTCEMCGLPAQ